MFSLRVVVYIPGVIETNFFWIRGDTLESQSAVVEFCLLTVSMLIRIPDNMTSGTSLMNLIIYSELEIIPIRYIHLKVMLKINN